MNFGHCYLPFDLAQGSEVVRLSNHLLFVFCYLKFIISETSTLTPETLRSLQVGRQKTAFKGLSHLIHDGRGT